MSITVPDPGGTRAYADVAAVVRDEAVEVVFQPIIELSSGTVVAHEALARGPAGRLHTPDALFRAAREAGLLAELDRICLTVALRAAAERFPTPSTVFVNVEPEALDFSAAQDLASLVDRESGLRVVLEITERAVAARPAELLRTVEKVHQLGWGVALDDVGAEAASLAFMSLLRPDVIKLDLDLVQRTPGEATASVMHAVNAHAERTGAWVLAEGIETPAHETAALAMGAALGQGWRYGRPSPTPVPTSREP